MNAGVGFLKFDLIVVPYGGIRICPTVAGGSNSRSDLLAVQRQTHDRILQGCAVGVEAKRIYREFTEIHRKRVGITLAAMEKDLTERLVRNIRHIVGTNNNGTAGIHGRIRIIGKATVDQQQVETGNIQRLLGHGKISRFLSRTYGNCDHGQYCYQHKRQKDSCKAFHFLYSPSYIIENDLLGLRQKNNT